MRERTIGRTAVLLLFIAPASAQDPNDAGYLKEHTPTKRVVPYPHIREADVLWHKRVWRTIDLREKLNHPLYYPVEPIKDRKSLFDVIRHALLLDGSLTAYDVGVIGQDDEFTKALPASELKDIFLRIDTQYTEDINTGEMIPVAQEIPLESRDIKQYRLKEDWIFDKQRGVVDIRIIGIAPMKELRGEDGEVRGFTPIFWLYYPECRYVFANHESFNPHNDAQRIPYESLFMKRMFSSTITKVSNVYDRSINTTLTGVDALLQGEAIKQELFEFEHDLWHW
jgi:gliding motility associated protien GldN